ncbi:hypothetical protein L6452_16656 [Arctium lappa]|uniref:Uncharacterized protein n=1 Tax=Arctium lappa TaxID=4217 RepID=A0ACB9C1D8_ARCLA|nr:hypothetical protein L6452_16656 [Arctium lappa]
MVEVLLKKKEKKGPSNVAKTLDVLPHPSSTSPALPPSTSRHFITFIGSIFAPTLILLCLSIFYLLLLLFNYIETFETLIPNKKNKGDASCNCSSSPFHYCQIRLGTTITHVPSMALTQ